MPISIKVQDVFKKLRTTQALNKITTTFEEGGLHGIIGSEGAGKTTLLRNLIGLLRPDTGKISYYDDAKQVTLASVRESFSYMPAKQSLYADLSVDEHLKFFAELYRVPRHLFAGKKEKLLHLARLDTFTSRRAGELSGGMYKKLGLICALLQSPRALLLDEPTNGVDPISRREFWDLLYALSSEKILIIISTAYMDEAERCTKVHLLEKGGLLEAGEPRDVLKKEGVESFDRFFIMREKNGD